MPSDSLEQTLSEFRKARDACDRSVVDLSLNRRRVRSWLEELVVEAKPDETVDLYGEREVIANFEQEIATLLGKPAAVFMPSGTMAQQIALRVWADREGVRRVAFHPTCHLELHEEKGYQALHHLEGVLVGTATQLITLDDLKGIRGRIAVLLLELPQREIGGQLPDWEALKAQIAWARERGIRLHLDGARLWEAAPAMQRSLPEIAGLFDSVYVSMYKGLGAIAGAVLCGPDDFIAEARLWQQRHGGRIIRIFPLVIAARAALHRQLDRFPLYHERALRLAKALTAVSGVRIIPDPPHAHMMHVYLPGTVETLLRRATAIAEKERVALFRYLDAAEVPGHSRAELEVGEETLKVSDAEVIALFGRLVQQA
ncbi:MAG: beta-eliminating lyase-related protein [Candidatus Dormibacteraeota bacterium]|nr:beta-eliminating lyase-related protein [Candidatus Dormibacteraeota bacterium]